MRWRGRRYRARRANRNGSALSSTTMMLFDHGMPPGPKQSPKADINIEYQRDSRMAAESAKLAAALQAANRSHARYPATIGANMAGTDSIRFQDLVAAVSVRENERVTGIVMGFKPESS